MKNLKHSELSNDLNSGMDKNTIKDIGRTNTNPDTFTISGENDDFWYHYSSKEDYNHDKKILGL